MKENSKFNIYSKEPLYIESEIPVFSSENGYTRNYERISTDHLKEENITGRNPFMEQKLREELENSTLKLIMKYIPRGSRILDVGVGIGRLLGNLTDMEIYGMDISFEYLKVAKSKGIQVCYSLIEDMPYNENYFDAVTCTDVLEHVLDLNSSCQKILSVLKPEGIMIVRVPYKEDLSCYLNQYTPYEFIHLRSFDKTNLILHFEKVTGNCKVIDSTFAGFIPSKSRLRYRLPLVNLHAIVYVLWMVMKWFNSKIARLFLKKCYRPVEINLVIRKK